MSGDRNHRDESPVGSPAWAASTDGRLSRAEARQVRVGVLRDAVRLGRSRVLLLLGRGRRSGTAPLARLDVPDTALAREVEQVARAGQSRLIFDHALRSLAFGHAIAGLDGIDVDPELLWCACLLHDIALEHPVEGVCFAVRGGRIARDVARRAGASAEVGDVLADAITRHITPDLDPSRHPVPAVLAAGALVDILGTRLDDLRRDFVQAVLAAHPRDGFARALATAWRAEARAVPRGRAAVIDRTACFSLIARWAPPPE